MFSIGVIYIATGKRYIEEACHSVSTLKSYMPHIHVTAFLSEEVACSDFNDIRVIDSPRYSFMDKVLSIVQTPYDFTLFLDTDTHIVDDISELFTVLDKFDIAAPHAPIDHFISAVPSTFPELNTGVIAFKKNQKVEKFFFRWHNLYTRDMEQEETIGIFPDQPSFREALYDSELRICFLPHEYNCMVGYTVFLSGKVKIFHGRDQNLPAIIQSINQKCGKLRSFVPKLGTVTLVNNFISIDPLEKISYT
ncbi:MAG: hypothetical protein ACKO11_02305 [Cuspidothrix sp.]